MNALRRLAALLVTLVGLTGVAWAGGHETHSFYDDHFNHGELTSQF